MARKPATTAKPSSPATEQIPSVQDGLSGIASAGAPVIFFNLVPTSGFYNGVAHMTLETLRFVAVDGVIRRDRMIVGHLRMNYPALIALKSAVVNAEEAARTAAAAAATETKH